MWKRLLLSPTCDDRRVNTSLSSLVTTTRFTASEQEINERLAAFAGLLFRGADADTWHADEISSGLELGWPLRRCTRCLSVRVNVRVNDTSWPNPGRRRKPLVDRFCPSIRRDIRRFPSIERAFGQRYRLRYSRSLRFIIARDPASLSGETAVLQHRPD